MRDVATSLKLVSIVWQLIVAFKILWRDSIERGILSLYLRATKNVYATTYVESTNYISIIVSNSFVLPSRNYRIVFLYGYGISEAIHWRVSAKSVYIG